MKGFLTATVMVSPMLDPHGRPVTGLRISVTERCNLRCDYCHREGSDAGAGVEMTPKEIGTVVRVGTGFGVRSVKLTGGEPLVRKDISDVVAAVRAVEGIRNISMTTNGVLLESFAADLKAAGLTRVNVSLDTLDPDRYRRITRGGDLTAVLRGVDAALAADLKPLKLNAIVMRGENDSELADLVRFAMDRDVEMRFLELISIGAAVDCHTRYFVQLEEVLSALRRDFEVETLPRTSRGPATSHVVTERGSGRRTRIGTIASETKPFCSTCNRLRLTSRGELRACLMSPAGVDLRRWVRSPEKDAGEFDSIVRSVLALKPALRGPHASHQMSQVGG